MRDYDSGYEREYSLLGEWETNWYRRKSNGNYERCNSYDKGAVGVKRCTCCGREIHGYRCTCEESKW